MAVLHSIAADDYPDSVEALCRVQPLIVLDTFFVGTATEQRAMARLLGFLREHRRNPLDVITVDTLIEWCNREPDSRYVAIAEVIPFLKFADGEYLSSQWSPTAIQLINSAPDPLTIVRAFTKRFRPSGWSGSLASILEGRKALLQELANHPNPNVAAFAAEEANRLDVEIAAERRWEAELDRRDERFE